MSNVWVLTVGGSDVYLKSDTNWTKLRRDTSDSLICNREFRPQKEKDFDGNH